MDKLSTVEQPYKFRDFVERIRIPSWILTYLALRPTRGRIGGQQEPVLVLFEWHDGLNGWLALGLLEGDLSQIWSCFDIAM